MDKDDFAVRALALERSLYCIARSYLAAEADCEDAVGEAIATAFSKLYTLRQEKYAKTWLTKILIRECYRVLKLRKRTTSVGEEMDNLIEFSSRDERRDYSELYEALGELSKEQRTVTVLYYLEGYSVKEVAKITGVTQGTVKSRLSRARNHLKYMLDDKEIITGDDLNQEKINMQGSIRVV